MDWDISKQPIYDKWRTYWFATHPYEIADYSWNYLFTGGKQIRPKLFCELWHYLSPDLKVNTELAFAIECIHVASTVLDDTPWMDNATERRGKKTLHAVFSPKKALLITYDLLQIVDMIWTNNKPSHISPDDWKHLLKSKLQRLVLGQYYDIEKKGTLIELASLKTGVLFELVTECVASWVHLDTEFWKIWGNNLGILFQWMDDWHDREEDLVQQNRNAFQENYYQTLQNYSYIWYKLESGIGQQWFLRPFGEFMKHYFTGNFLLVSKDDDQKLLDKIAIPYQDYISFPELELTKHVNLEGLPASIFTGKDILKRLWKASNQMNEFPTMQVNLWNIEEAKWDEIEEVKHYTRLFDL